MAGSLENKIALVTGGASGIGRSSCQLFARERAKVVVVDVQVEMGEETVRLVKDAGGEAMFIKCDVSKSSDVEAMINQCVKAYGRLDCAVNNAAILGEMGKVHECTEENFNRIMAINLKGIWLCLKYEIPQMLKQGSGAIVNIASCAGNMATPDLPVYGASKAGVAMITRSAAMGLARDNIRINAINPGFIQTPMVDKQEQDYPDKVKEYKANQPMGRMGRPEEIAEAVVWLCSDAASLVMGHVMHVDGCLQA